MSASRWLASRGGIVMRTHCVVRGWYLGVARRIIVITLI